MADEVSKTLVSERCPRLLVGMGNDTSDPGCLMPAGHAGACTADAVEALIRLHIAYDDSGSTVDAWERLRAHKRLLREQGHESDVDRYEERVSEAANARGYW